MDRQSLVTHVYKCEHCDLTFTYDEQKNISKKQKLLKCKIINNDNFK